MSPAAMVRTLTHIQAHLDGDLSLKALAAVAGARGGRTGPGTRGEFSPPYFARRFAAMVGETAKQYTLRLRLERAALRVLDIALDCGFQGPENFTRAFRKRFGLSPIEFRRNGRLLDAADAAAGQEVPHRAEAATPVSLSTTVVRTLQPLSLAFLRHVGPYEEVPLGLWEKLIAWGHRRGMASPFVLLGVAHDAPGITDAGKLRFDAAIRVAVEFSPGRREKVGYQRLAGGLFALTTSVGPLSSLPGAYARIFKRIRADRSLDCVGLPCLEFYRVHRIDTRLPMAIVETEIALPVRRRRGRIG